MNVARQITVITMQLLLCSICTNAYAKNTENWQLVLAEDPFTKATACLMISTSKITQDGQATTPVHLIYNGTVFIAKTESNIDLSYEGSGLQVDSGSTHNVDRLFKKTSAVFATQVENIREEFIKGLKARLTLGFWPTWPKTTSYKIVFDLHGFTRTYGAFKRCQQSGEIL